jgi:hypothetical protein
MLLSATVPGGTRVHSRRMDESTRKKIARAAPSLLI